MDRPIKPVKESATKNTGMVNRALKTELFPPPTSPPFLRPSIVLVVNRKIKKAFSVVLTMLKFHIEVSIIVNNSIRFIDWTYSYWLSEKTFSLQILIASLFEHYQIT